MKEPTIKKAYKKLEEYFAPYCGDTLKKEFKEGTRKYVLSVLKDLYEGASADGFANAFYQMMEEQENNDGSVAAIEDSLTYKHSDEYKSLAEQGRKDYDQLKSMFDETPFDNVCDMVKNDKRMSFGACSPDNTQNMIDVNFGCICASFVKMPNGFAEISEEFELYNKDGKYIDTIRVES
jgi:hypothetical protein